MRLGPGRWLVLGLIVEAASAAHTNNIMLTGYWPPTNNMIRRFSTNPAQNPQGWIGRNWEGRGYDIYAFFPEVQVGQQGTGDFEVDYQDTSSDWWRITAEIRPVAIITFSWTPGTPWYQYRDWELEARNRNRDSWTDDYSDPRQPDQVPPDPSLPANATRSSTLPMQRIVDAMLAAPVMPWPYIDNSEACGGTFLSEYIGYHGLWYQSLHADPNDPAWCVAAGHIHVSGQLSPTRAWNGTQLTLRVLTDYLNEVIPEPSALLLILAGGLLLRRRPV